MHPFHYRSPAASGGECAPTVATLLSDVMFPEVLDTDMSWVLVLRMYFMDLFGQAAQMHNFDVPKEHRGQL